jgi:beta-glucanase (GH16 family)
MDGYRPSAGFEQKLPAFGSTAQRTQRRVSLACHDGLGGRSRPDTRLNFTFASQGRIMSRLLALALAALALVLPAAADAATVGTTTVYAPATTNDKGVAQVYRFTAQTSGNIDQLSVYLDGASTASAVELGLYSGSASTATTRRARCVIASPKAGAWNRCSVTAYAVTAGTPYWLAVLQPSSATGQIQYREGQVANGPATYASKSRRLASLPATWANGTSRTGGYQASLYADEAAAPTPTPTPDPSGYTLIFEDNFNGTAVDTTKWNLYNGAGHAGNGLRRPSQCTTDGSGLLVLTAQAKVDPADGVLKTWSCGMSTRYPTYGSTTYGAFESRVRCEADPSATMSCLTLTWPDAGGNSLNGELDWYETGTDTDRIPFKAFLHWPNCPSGTTCQTAFTYNADGKQWHDMRMEWGPNRIDLYMDGVLVGSETNPDHIPDVPHHAVAQLDARKSAPVPAPVHEYVDYIRVYKKG